MLTIIVVTKKTSVVSMWMKLKFLYVAIDNVHGSSKVVWQGLSWQSVV